jgi:hypothetical protein
MAFADAVVRLSSETASVKHAMAIHACWDRAPATMHNVAPTIPPTANDLRTDAAA